MNAKGLEEGVDGNQCELASKYQKDMEDIFQMNCIQFSIYRPKCFIAFNKLTLEVQ